MIYIVYGDEPYFIDKAKNEIRNGIDPIDYAIFDGFTRDVSEHLTQVAFLSDKKAATVNIGSLKELDNDAFRRILTYPDCSFNLLVIANEVDKRTKFAKELSKRKLLVECDKVREEKTLKAVLSKELSNIGMDMEDDAMDEFVKRLNYFDNGSINLLQAINYLKCLSEVSESKKIKKEEVDMYIPSHEIGDVKLLLELIQKKDTAELMNQLNLLSSKEAIGDMSLLLYNYRVALKGKYTNLKSVGGYTKVFKLGKEQLVKAVDILNDNISSIKRGIPGDIAIKNACILLTGLYQ